MDAPQVHRAISADGTQVAGRVQGQGPPLVLVNGGMGDGDLTHGALLPHLTERFTCYTMSTRGRGLSADHPVHTPERLVQDVIAFADSIGEPCGLVGHSSAWVLGAAARASSVASVAAYEPAAPAVLEEDDAARVEAAFARMSEAAQAHRLVEAARVFAEECGLFDTDEIARVDDYFEARGRYVPVSMHDMRDAARGQGPGPTDPAVLADVAAPVLLLYGSKSHPWFQASVHHLAEHLDDVRVRVIDGVAHLGPVLAASEVADELARFFAGRTAAVT